jgi:hypothetical protein
VSRIILIVQLAMGYWRACPTKSTDIVAASRPFQISYDWHAKILLSSINPT